MYHCVVWSFIAIFNAWINVFVLANEGTATQEICIANMTRIFHERPYDKRHPPSLTKSTTVQLGLYINSFNYISEQSMDYEINIYLRQQWLDERLAFNMSPTCRANWLRLPDDSWDMIWRPDVFFRNEKRASFHDVTMPNRMMRMYPNGTVYYVAKVTATLSCPMKLHKYPLDTQFCPIMFESFGYTVEVLKFNWQTPPLETGQDLMMPQFQLHAYNLENCSQVYVTGNYACLQVVFVLKRNIGYYLIQIYIPSVLIVILSWVAFWISIDAIPARVTIGLLTVLTMTTQSGTARASLPRVSYIKALDVWMIVCLVFVFMSLLEFAFVNVWSRRDVRRKGLERLARGLDEFCVKSTMGLLNPIGATPRPVSSANRLEEMRQRARTIDKLSRRLFPLAFVLFNVVYWIGYNLW